MKKSKAGVKTDVELLALFALSLIFIGLSLNTFNPKEVEGLVAVFTLIDIGFPLHSIKWEGVLKNYLLAVIPYSLFFSIVLASAVNSIETNPTKISEGE